MSLRKGPIDALVVFFKLLDAEEGVSFVFVSVEYVQWVVNGKDFKQIGLGGVGVWN